LITPTESLQALKSSLLELESQFRQARDEIGTCSIKELRNKLEREEMHIAFCGHICSGKSALLNKLLGHDLLPTSPIPSSANIVTIHQGAPAAVIKIPSEEGASSTEVDCAYPGTSTLKLNPDKDLPLIHQYCLNKKSAEALSLTFPHQLDVPGLVLMDTPGIDSAEKAKKLAQEPAIVTADVVVYVMDYNHVQSEINFTFAKMMKEQGKRLLLVVHQIDKHCDFELDFSYFKSSSQAGFAAWDVHPEGLFFTTLLDHEQEENQRELLQEVLISLARERQALLPGTIYHAAQQLVRDHCARQRAQQEQLRQQWQEEIDKIDDLDQALESYHALQEQYDRLHGRTERLQADLEREIVQIVENARITPYTMTQLAEEYLLSRQSGFKVGFFFTAEKTKQEVQRRLQALTDELAQHVSTQLEWHLRGILAKIPESYGISDSAYMQEANAFSVAWDSDLIASAVKAGALANNEYIHNFTRDIAYEVKRIYRREALALAEKAVLLAHKESEQDLAQLEVRLQPLKPLVEALRNLEKMDQAERHYQTSLLRPLEKKAPPRLSLQALIPALHGENGEKQKDGDPKSETKSLGQAIYESAASTASASLLSPNGALNSKDRARNSNERNERNDRNDSPAATEGRGALQQMGTKLRTFAQTVEDLPSFAHMAQALRQRAQRLEENIFTVALFGAFSAGKSSVANALLGQFVLPVSPNPTTAAINKILPPNHCYPHGTVRVQLKSSTYIESDVLHSLKACDLEAKSLEEALERLAELSPSQIHPAAKPHYSFLQAVSKGLSHVQEHLGTVQMIDLVAFNDYVASEEKACFVEWIELYYSCPLTDHGIMLVDTPGADSINARHTGVAFDYIKNADAVLFVTYFNSAFSHADRDFSFNWVESKILLPWTRCFSSSTPPTWPRRPRP
jgi:predicted GTPase